MTIERRLKKNQKRRARRFNAQKREAAIRAKYGPAGKPSKVVVRSLDTGEVERVVDQVRLTRRPSEGLHRHNRRSRH